MSSVIQDSSGAWGRDQRSGGSAVWRPAGLRRGFTLLEIMVVVTIISVLAMLVVPAFARIQRRAKTTTIMNDFRVFETAFVACSQENGT
ncbi:MAG: prepilin-type N-terminal cleavage/methylation domain-containing protein [Opitutus sp.]|nr:prepilin-type N-terminal cleavage/methylation domain-containing protein [Opitutus sp.]